jgi:hypothetical protein
MAALSLRNRAGLTLALGAVLFACSSGPVTETPFVQAASEAASLLSAGAETLRFVHSQRFTVEYGRAATINYHELVASLPEELPHLEGAPDQATVDRLMTMLEGAVADLANPCLLQGCDWESQVSRLDQAKQALLDATE